jgi:hypothetical protein
MAKIKTFQRCGQEIEIDLENPDTDLRTLCAICHCILIPSFHGEPREICEEALFGICWRCSMYDKNGKRAVMSPEELKEHSVLMRKAGRQAHVDKIRQRIADRDGKVTMRPCGCGIKGRHRDSCELSQGYKKPGRKSSNA